MSVSTAWKTVALTDVCDFQGGTQPPKEIFIDEPADGYIRLIQIQDFTREDRAVFIPKTPKLKTCAKTDILIARYGASLGRILTGLEGAYNVALVKTIPDKSRIARGYFWHFLRSSNFQQFLRTLASRAAQAGFNKDDLSRLTIPLPPVTEQRRIAAILDKADAIRRQREEGIRLTEELLRSTFLDMFGDPQSNTKGWELRPVSEIVSEMEGGKSILADAEDSRSTQYRVLKVSAVTWADYRSHESKPVPSGYIPPSAHIVRKGDLLFSRANTTELVGATVYVFDTPPNHLLPDKLWRFIWRDDRRVDPQYIRILFMTAAIKRELGKRATGTSGSMKNISKAKLMTIPIPIPPIELQRKFGRFAMAHHMTIRARQEGAESTAALFDSLVQRAFRGEL